MPTLLEVQRAVRASLVDRDDGAAAAMLADEPDRLNIYRNTFVIGVTKALRLSYPAVHRLVGETFFDGAAALFVIGGDKGPTVHLSKRFLQFQMETKDK